MSDVKDIKDYVSLFNYAEGKYENSAQYKVNIKSIKDPKKMSRARSLGMFGHAFGVVQKLEKQNPQKKEDYRKMLRSVRRILKLNKEDASIKGDK